ncbi:MAG: FeoA family protein [bacterium]|nr:FeoA family protein [bacterium]
MENEKVSLSDMKAGQTGVIVELHGRQGMISKLSTLGIRVGEKIKKISQQAMRGPVVVEVGRSQVAIGFGMAGRVLVEAAKEAGKR